VTRLVTVATAIGLVFTGVTTANSVPFAGLGQTRHRLSVFGCPLDEPLVSDKMWLVRGGT